MGTPLQRRVGQLIRLPSSERVGEAGAPAEALHDALVSAGLDVHWLAEVVVGALEAIDRQDDLCADVEISVRHDGRYRQIVGRGVREVAVAR
jgi:hypothetical protein